MVSNLHEFIASLDHQGELQRVTVPVSTTGELAAITRRISGRPHGGSALLFQQPLGFHLPVAANLFGSRRRLQTALGSAQLQDLTRQFGQLFAGCPATGLQQLGNRLARLPELNDYRPVPVGGGPCLEQLQPGADLLQLPLPVNWPFDGTAAGSGRYLTLGQVITAMPDGSSPNCGIYRCQVHDSRTLAIRWQPGSGADRHFQQFRQQHNPMPLAIVLGGPPALTLAAAWPLPEQLDEITFAGWLRGGSIPTVSCSHGPLQAPAEAELLLEGFAEPDQPLLEGPFGNHTGRYTPAGPAVRVRITRITRRHNALLPVTLVGPPPQEDCWMMLGWERLLAALLPCLVPGVRDIRLPLPWVFRQSAIIALDHSSPSQVRDTVAQLWQLPWFSKARLLILVDAAVAPHNLLQVAWRLVNEADWLDDLIRDEAGGRLAVDATRRSAEELLDDPATEHLITERWNEYGLS